MAIIDKKNSEFSASRAAFLRWLLPFCGIMFFLACSGEEKEGPYKAFYFPFEEMTEGKVYEYASTSAVGDTIITEYWAYKSVKDEKGWQLMGTYYDSYFQVRQFFRETMHTTGSLMEDYFLYQSDSIGVTQRYDAELKAANGFPFMLKDTNSILLFDLQWTFSEDPVHRISLTRNRQYRGQSIFSFQGNRLPAITFDLRERIDDEQEGHLEKEYTGMEIYAKGLGLVYYRKDLDENIVMEYQLEAIYTMAEFEEKFKAETH